VPGIDCFMLERLEKFYKRNGILSTSFTCKHKDDCKGDCDTFTGPKSAFVSSGYVENKLPRLLFLSLDSGSGDPDENNRLPAAVRQQEEIDRDIRPLHKGKHWYRTHELAWYILKRFRPELKIEEAKGFFSHANSAKCCMNNKHKRKASGKLFENCRGYLKGELDILAPQLLVTQGHEAKQAIALLAEKTIDEIDEFSSVIALSGNPVFWLHTYHPRNGRFNTQRNFCKKTGVALGWEFYSGEMYQFVNRETTL